MSAATDYLLSPVGRKMYVRNEMLVNKQVFSFANAMSALQVLIKKQERNENNTFFCPLNFYLTRFLFSGTFF